MSGEQFSGPWLPWYHGDFLRATQGWTIAERGVYFLLLGASWEMGPLPDDRRRLAGIVGAQLDEFDQAWKIVRHKFELTGSGFVNRRLEQHRANQALRSEKARQSANRRWQDANADASGHASADANAHASAYASGDAREDAKPMLEGMRSGCSSELIPQKSEIQKSEPKVRGPNSRAARSTATRLPADFELSGDLQAFAESEGLDPQRTFEKFTDYWKAASGAKARKLDWPATFKNWCRNEHDRAGAKGNGTAAPRRRPKTPAELEALEAAANAAR